MDDIKNFFLAWCSTVPWLVAVEPSIASIISAVVLPIVFFTVGKTIDVILQIYFRLRDERQKHDR